MLICLFLFDVITHFSRACLFVILFSRASLFFHVIISRNSVSRAYLLFDVITQFSCAYLLFDFVLISWLFDVLTHFSRAYLFFC